jgi:hypothetical protein
MTTPAYPHPCNRCGFCCLAQPCPAELVIFGPRAPGGKCPALSFEGDVATCGLVATYSREKMGIDQGCCIKATAVIGHERLDFAAMPDELKIVAARQARSRRVLMMDAKPN